MVRGAHQGTVIGQGVCMGAEDGVCVWAGEEGEGEGEIFIDVRWNGRGKVHKVMFGQFLKKK